MKVTSLYLIGICLIGQVDILVAADGKKEISKQDGLEWQSLITALDVLDHKQPLDDINKKNEEGNTLLHIACKHCCNKSSENIAGGLVVKALLKAKADMGVQNSDGYTPLHMYTIWHRSCCSSIEKVLLQYGASKDDAMACLVRMALAI